MRPWIASLVAAVATVFSCHSLQFAVDPSFSPNDVNEIHRAALEWNSHTRPSHKITFDGDSWRILQEDPGTGYNGWTSRSEGIIKMRAYHPDATTFEVSLHEFGHALGLGHTSTGVMMATKVDVTFTAEVFEECIQAGAC